MQMSGDHPFQHTSIQTNCPNSVQFLLSFNAYIMISPTSHGPVVRFIICFVTVRLSRGRRPLLGQTRKGKIMTYIRPQPATHVSGAQVAAAGCEVRVHAAAVLPAGHPPPGPAVQVAAAADPAHSPRPSLSRLRRLHGAATRTGLPSTTARACTPPPRHAAPRRRPPARRRSGVTAAALARRRKPYGLRVIGTSSVGAGGAQPKGPEAIPSRSELECTARSESLDSTQAEAISSESRVRVSIVDPGPRHCQ